MKDPAQELPPSSQQDQLAEVTLDALASHIAILDNDGLILAVNRAWRQFALENDSAPTAVSVGANYFAVCRRAISEDEDPLAEAALTGISRVMQGEQAEFRLEYPCHSPDQERWFLMRVFPLRLEPEAVVVVHTNITLQRQNAARLAYQANILQQVSDAIIATDTELRVTSWNKPAEKIYGWTAEEALGQILDELLQTEFANQTRQEAQEILVKEKMWRGELRQKRKDGQQVDILASVTFLEDPTGQPVGGVTINRDITEDKQAERELQHVNAELERHLEQLAALNLIAQTMATVSDLSNALKIVSRSIVRLFDGQGALISLLDESKTAWKVLAHFSNLDGPDLTGDVLPISNPEDKLHRQLFQGRSLIIDQPQSNPLIKPVRKILKTYQVESLLNAPLQIRGETIGVIAVTASQTHRKFTASDLKLAETIAGQIASPIETARLFAQERRQRQIAESLQQVAAVLNSSLDLEVVLDRILLQLDKVMEQDGGAIFLKEADDLVLSKGVGPAAHAHQGERIPLASQNPTVRPLKEKQLVIINQADQETDWLTWPEGDVIRAWMGAPLWVGDELTGVLTVDNFTPEFRYSAEDGQILQTLANQAAIAIQNAQLYEQTQKDAQTKATLLEEVNHRVKNNLASIVGLLHLEAERTFEHNLPICHGILSDLMGRVEGLVTVHRMLSGVDWSAIYLDDLAEKVIDSALQARPLNQFVQVEIVSTSTVKITPKLANNLALILNELATNSLKYAWSPDELGQITVEITVDDEWIQLEFRDDGRGFPEDVLALEEYNVGWELIQTLVRHSLRGQLSLSNQQGAVVTLRFPLSLANR